MNLRVAPPPAGRHSALHTDRRTEIVRLAYQLIAERCLQGVRFDVNAAYPDGLPLQSMPPSLLLNLPQLSKELEYRFVGRELILRDAPANLIVDVIPDLSIP